MKEKEEYLENTIKPIMENLIFQLVLERPEDPANYMIDWLQKTGGYTVNGLTIEEKEELDNLRLEVCKYREKGAIFNNDSDDSEADSQDENDQVTKLHNLKGRAGVSAEAYGHFNKRENFRPRNIQKSESQIQRIKAKIIKSVIFSSLDNNDLNIIIGAMEER